MIPSSNPRQVTGFPPGSGGRGAPAPSSLRPRGGRARLIRLLAPLALAVLLAGCSDAAYYWQAGLGQWDILSRRRAIGEVLADPQVDEQVKAKLRLVLRVQAFGRERLGLTAASQFHYYSDLGREYVTWLVVASDAYAIKEYQHCYFIVGCLGYRGFFAKEEAGEFAAELAEEGYDVLVRPVRAYSTLGWFDDPVLNTFINSGDLNLISTILHEQAHTLMFVKGDTAFNESFSTFVEEEGVRRFLEQEPSGAARLTRYHAINEERRRFRELVIRGRERLERLYASGLAQAKLAAEKPRLFLMLKEDYQRERNSFKIVSYDGWFNRKLNNAHLVGMQHYRSWVKAFRVLFDQHGGDFARFYEAVRELAERPKDEREARLKSLEEKRIANS